MRTFEHKFEVNIAVSFQIGTEYVHKLLKNTQFATLKSFLFYQCSTFLVQNWNYSRDKLLPEAVAKTHLLACTLKTIYCNLLMIANYHLKSYLLLIANYHLKPIYC
jgi:hypothetical protein